MNFRGKAGGETPGRIPPQEGEEEQSQPCKEGTAGPKGALQGFTNDKSDPRTDGRTVRAQPSGDGSHFPEFAAVLRDEGICDNIVGCVICDKYPRGFELRVKEWRLHTAPSWNLR